MWHTILLVSVIGLMLPARTRAAGVDATIDATPGGTLRVTLQRGTVDVTTHDRDMVTVSAHTTADSIWRADVDLHRAADGEGIELTGRIVTGDGFVAKTIAWALWPLWPVTLDVRLAVPREYSIVVRTAGGHVTAAGLRGQVDLETSGGAVDLHDIAGDVAAKTAGGRIDVADVTGHVQAQTSGGAIGIDQVNGPIDVRTSGGRIDVRDATGEVTASTSGGAVFSSFAGAPHGSLETSGGSIEVRVPADAGAELDARTSGGRVQVANPLVVAGGGDAQHVIGRLNGGGAPLRLRTSGGNIYVGVRDVR
jgi:DUF4097 and DUF4098 domain-containing protein YvlB